MSTETTAATTAGTPATSPADPVEEVSADDYGHARTLDVDHDWYKRAVFYEVLVRAFNDSNGDGTGDLRGLTEKLDYLQWLGVDCLWLPPFYDSPLRDGGYDIRDFRTVLPEFGTVEDFVTLLDEAHKRGIRVITDLVMNHTSDTAPVVPGVAAPPRRALRRLLRLVRRRHALPRRADHLRRHRAVELDLRPGARAVLLAPVLLPPARPELRQPGRAGGHARRPAVLARPRHRRLPARRGALPLRARRHELREPPRDPRVPASAAARCSTTSTPAGCCSPRPTSGRRTSSSTSATPRSAATSATWRSTSR